MSNLSIWKRNKLLRDEEELRPKKVFVKLEKASKSSYNFKLKKSQKTKPNKPSNINAICKITSGSKSLGAVKAHINYIRRDGKLDLIDQDGMIITEDFIESTLKDFAIVGEEIPSDTDIKNYPELKKKYTHNIIFSTKKYSNFNENLLKNIVFKTIKARFPDNNFVMAYHNDTNNPHIHVCLKIADRNGKRHLIQKADLLKLKLEYENQFDLKGFAMVSHKKDWMKKLYIEEKRQKSPQYFKVFDYGIDHYNFDPNAKKTCFVRYQNGTKPITIWGDDLKRLIIEHQIEKGEYVRFRKIGHVAKRVSTPVKKKGKDYILERDIKVAKWDVAIKHRLEKDKFEILPPVEEYIKLIPVKKKEVKVNERTQPVRQPINRTRAKTIPAESKRDKSGEQPSTERTAEEKATIRKQRARSQYLHKCHNKWAKKWKKRKLTTTKRNDLRVLSISDVAVVRGGSKVLLQSNRSDDLSIKRTSNHEVRQSAHRNSKPPKSRGGGYER